MTDEPELRVAIIGCGFQGAFHADAFNKVRGARVTVCADADPVAATELAARYEDCAATTDWVGTIEDPLVDAVVIATPTHTHHEMAMVAAGSAKPMLLEKPMATSVDDCLMIESATNASGSLLMMGFKFRFAPAVLRAKKAVPEGQILSGHTLYDSGQITSTWVSEPEKSGGRVTSSLVHTVDLLRFLTSSEPVRVAAESTDSLDLGEPTTIAATMFFENGAIATLLHGTSTQSPLLSAWSFITSTTEASATLFDHCRRVAVRSNSTNQEVFVDDTRDPFATGMMGMAQAFVDSVATSTAQPPNARDGVVSLVTSRAIERAAACGEVQTVEIPAPA